MAEIHEPFAGRSNDWREGYEFGVSTTIKEFRVLQERRLLQEGAPEIDHLKVELGRAYRAIRGFFSFVENGAQPDKSFLGYHSPTIAAAMRFVTEGATDGAEYFVGKNVDVLHAALRRKD